MRLSDIAGVFVLGALWGASFLFMRVAAPEFNAAPVAVGRVAIGGLLVLAVAVRLGTRFDLRGRWRQYALLATVNTAVPFVLIAAAATQLPASVSSILIATTPVFVALSGWLWLREPLGARQVLGVTLGLAGVAILVGWAPMAMSTRVVLAVAAMVVSALCYGIGTHYSARMLRARPGMAIPVMQQLGAGVLLSPLALATLPEDPPTGRAIGSVVALGLLSTGVAYLLFFRLIRRIGPLRANIATYLTPAFGVLWGAMLLDERLSAGSFVGFAVIVASALLMSDLPLSRPAVRRVVGAAPVDAPRG